MHFLNCKPFTRDGSRLHHSEFNQSPRLGLRFHLLVFLFSVCHLSQIGLRRLVITNSNDTEFMDIYKDRLDICKSSSLGGHTRIRIWKKQSP